MLFVYVSFMVFKDFLNEQIKMIQAALIIQLMVLSATKNTLSCSMHTCFMNDHLTLIKSASLCWPHDELHFYIEIIIEACVSQKMSMML